MPATPLPLPPDDSAIRGLPMTADLYCELFQPEKASRLDYLPGLMVVGLAVLAAAYVSDHYGVPLTLMSLLVGLSLNFLNADRRLHPGLMLASHRLLRIGIVLVGMRVTVGQIVDLGPVALLCIAAITALTILSGVVLSRLQGFSTAFGVLAGGAVAICGASAAMALATMLGERRINQAQLTTVLVGIAAMSAAAMFFYPMLAWEFGLSDRQAGFFLGAAIHDVAQALGAGYAVSNIAGDTAAIVKLTRVALLVPVLLIVSLVIGRREGMDRAKAGIPWFIFGFLALVIFNSTVAVPSMIGDAATAISAVLIAAAVTATGIRSPMQILLKSGLRPMIVILGPTVIAAALAWSVTELILQM
ncbi:YeiH family protein [Rhizorhapis suberifaciens]|uniref:Putative integral membrane protein (TIGR00698 family) n=1 Tax=Rhizorhapis suberifaciens TaxID=13656 RepID=A0A840HW76_9SPHN|nr:putative sulfate exporter family transporter [Rhizorhapis suberifaciens]MBB4641839.1 putative integral membrane protein (TIGR00698 family) [Rhizorhapis suberifaciens]